MSTWPSGLLSRMLLDDSQSRTNTCSCGGNEARRSGLLACGLGTSGAPCSSIIIHPTSRGVGRFLGISSTLAGGRRRHAQDLKTLRVGFDEQAAAANHLALLSRRRRARAARDGEPPDRVGGARL